MIVRRYDRATGSEAKPVSIKQAARAIAQGEVNKLRTGRRGPGPQEMEIIEDALRSGIQHATAAYVYVPDADPVVSGDDWRQSIPACLVGDIDDAADLAEAVHLAVCQLDLIEEGQDGTEHYTRQNVRQIKKWIAEHRQR